MTKKAIAAPPSAVQARVSVDLTDLPATHRLGYWIDHICAASAEAECELHSEPQSLRGRLEHLSVGDLAINRLQVSAQTFRRTPAHLRHARQEVFALVQVRSGTAQVQQGGQRIVLGAGDLAINSGLDTGDMRLSDNADIVLTVIPAALMQSVTGSAHPRGTLLVSGNSPLAPLLHGFLHGLTDQPEQLSADSAAPPAQRPAEHRGGGVRRPHRRPTGRAEPAGRLPPRARADLHAAAPGHAGPRRGHHRPGG